nr:tetratricopeptide repeat protein [Armatimonadota bacterium]
LVQARSYFSQGEIHEGCVALENLRTFQDMSPVLDADIAMAHCHGSFEADRYADAANWASVALRFLDDTEGYPHLRREAQLWLARSMTRQGQAPEAEELIDDALQSAGVSHTERAELLHARGEAYLARGDAEGAETSFREAVTADPDCARAWFSLGQRLARRDQLEDGEKCLRAAQSADPEGTWGRDAALALRTLEHQMKGSNDE